MGEWFDSPTGEAKRDPGYAVAQVVELPKYYQSIGDPWPLIQSKFDTTGEYAENSYNITNDFIGDLAALVGELERYNIANIRVDSPEVPSIDYQARPTVGDLDLEDHFWPPNTAEKPSLDPLTDMSEIVIPVFNIPDPVINMPDEPDEREITDPGEGPIIYNVSTPSVPTYVLPDVPTINEIAIPPVPQIDLPEFDADLREVVFTDPPGLSWDESAYNSEIWAVFLDKVREGILNGGTGLDPDVEQAIWDRALLRAQVSEQQDYEEIENRFAKAGWDMPSGPMASLLKEKSDEIQRNRSTLTFDIAVKQADMTYADSQFKIQMGLEGEKILRGFHDSQMNRLLDAQKSIAENAIQIVRLQVEKQNAYIEKYKADADVYRTRIEAARNQVEIFRAQIEGVKVSTEVQKNLVDLYTAQIGAVDAIVGIYKVEMEGANIKSQIEARKIDIYKATVDAYVANIGAEKAKYEVYGIQAEAEKIKAEVFGERVRAYAVVVDAKKTEIEAEVARLNAEATANNHELERYKSELQAYGIEVDAAAKKLEGIVRAFEGEVSAYNAETNAQATQYGALIKEIEARISEAEFNLRAAVVEVESQTQGYVALKKLQIDGITGVSNVSAQLAASAMNAVNASASFGYSSGESMSTSFSYGARSQESHSFSYKTKDPDGA